MNLIVWTASAKFTQYCESDVSCNAFIEQVIVCMKISVSQQTAGNAVKKAADNLVTAAKNAAIFEEQETTVIINQRFVGGIAQELEAQEKILRIEKELAAARNKLSQIRQAKYRAEEED